MYRPFRDSEEQVRIVWYPALPDAEPLPFPSLISNPYWEQDQYQFAEGVGECDVDSIVPTGKPRMKPGSGKGHFCGTEEDFREGGLYLPDDPPELIGMQGLPACCNPAAIGQGGVIDGGKAMMGGASTCPNSTVVEYDVLYPIAQSPTQQWWRTPDLIDTGVRVDFILYPNNPTVFEGGRGGWLGGVCGDFGVGWGQPLNYIQAAVKVNPLGPGYGAIDVGALVWFDGVDIRQYTHFRVLRIS